MVFRDLHEQLVSSERRGEQQSGGRNAIVVEPQKKVKPTFPIVSNRQPKAEKPNVEENDYK